MPVPVPLAPFVRSSTNPPSSRCCNSSASGAEELGTWVPKAYMTDCLVSVFFYAALSRGTGINVSYMSHFVRKRPLNGLDGGSDASFPSLYVQPIFENEIILELELIIVLLLDSRLVWWNKIWNMARIPKFVHNQLISPLDHFIKEKIISMG